MNTDPRSLWTTRAPRSCQHTSDTSETASYDCSTTACPAMDEPATNRDAHCPEELCAGSAEEEISAELSSKMINNAPRSARAANRYTITGTATKIA